MPTAVIYTVIFLSICIVMCLLQLPIFANIGIVFILLHDNLNSFGDFAFSYLAYPVIKR